MNWISDRNPKSPGMYAVYQFFGNDNPSYLGFGYFDGNGWLLPMQSGDYIFPYRSNPAWSVIDWGNDKFTEPKIKGANVR